MRFNRHCLAIAALVAGSAACALALDSSKLPTISFDENGFTKGEIPALKAGQNLHFDVPANLRLTYQFLDEIGDGRVLARCSGAQSYVPGTGINIPTTRPAAQARNGGTFAEYATVRALYFNLTGSIATGADRAKQADLASEYSYYLGLDVPLTWQQRKDKQDQIADKNDLIAQLQEEIKAYTGMSLNDAVRAIDQRQGMIRDLRRWRSTVPASTTAWSH